MKKFTSHEAARANFPDWAVTVSGVWKHQTKILGVSIFFLHHYSSPNRENAGRILDIQSALSQTSYSAQDKPQSHQDVLNDSTSVRVGELCNKAFQWTDSEDSPKWKLSPLSYWRKVGGQQTGKSPPLMGVCCFLSVTQLCPRSRAYHPQVQISLG